MGVMNRVLSWWQSRKEDAVYYPPPASVQAEARYQDLLQEAQTERLLKHGRRPAMDATARDALMHLLAFLAIRVQWQ